MAAGTNYLLAGGTVKSYTTTYSSNATIGSGMVITQNSLLKSVVTRFSSAGTWTGGIRVYTYSGGVLAGTEGVAFSHTVNASTVDTEIVLPTPIALTGGQSYFISLFTSSGTSVYPALLTPASSGSFTSTPSGFTASQSSPWWWWSATGDVYPNTGQSSAYWAFQGVYVDYPPPVVSSLSPNGTTVDNNAAVSLSWTYTDPGSIAQTAYEIGYRKRAQEALWTVVTGTTATSRSFPKDTFESGTEYEWYVKASNGNAYSVPVRTTFTVNSWITQTEVASSTATGVVDASAFTANDPWSFEVRVQDAGGVYGPWSSLATWVLGPPSNLYVRQAGVMKQSVNYVKQGGVWKQVAPTKKNTAGSF